jgi:hypothetical protein
MAPVGVLKAAEVGRSALSATSQERSLARLHEPHHIVFETPLIDHSIQVDELIR